MDRPIRVTKRPRTYWEEFIEPDPWYRNKMLEDVPPDELWAAVEDENLEDDGEESDPDPEDEDNEFENNLSDDNESSTASTDTAANTDEESGTLSEGE